MQYKLDSREPASQCGQGVVGDDIRPMIAYMDEITFNDGGTWA